MDVCGFVPTQQKHSAAGWELAVWLGFVKESEDPFARGALKVAALSNNYQPGFFFFPPD